MNIKSRQQGVSLFMSLVILVILSLLTITGMNVSIIESKVSSNLRDRDLSFQAAETSLRRAENYLKTTYPLPLFNGTEDGLLFLDTTRDLKKTSVWNGLTHRGGTDTTLLHIDSKPEYIIEQLPAVAESSGSLEAGQIVKESFFRITAKAKGATGASTVIVQSVFKRKH
jgi:type IV pilus assembly protein PilX